MDQPIIPYNASNIILDKPLVSENRIITKANLYVNGGIQAPGIYIGGVLTVIGDITTEYHIKAKEIRVKGNITAGGWIKAKGVIIASGSIKATYIYALGHDLNGISITCKMIHFRETPNAIREFWSSKPPLLPYRPIIKNNMLCYEEIKQKLLEKNINIEEIINTYPWHPLEIKAIKLFFENF